MVSSGHVLLYPCATPAPLSAKATFLHWSSLLGFDYVSSWSLLGECGIPTNKLVFHSDQWHSHHPMITNQKHIFMVIDVYVDGKILFYTIAM